LDLDRFSQFFQRNNWCDKLDTFPQPGVVIAFASCFGLCKLSKNISQDFVLFDQSLQNLKNRIEPGTCDCLIIGLTLGGGDTERD
jgi:hypothetical protein